MDLIIFDGEFLSYIFDNEFKNMLKELNIIDFIYLGFDKIPEEDYKHCYAFELVTAQRKISLWTNTKRRKEQIENLLKKLVEKNKNV